uniref:Uncharacterized protein n=1 Tax=Oryza glumipatula TaxID=40148 RepID=A0A0D9Y3Q4_9ORYZ
MSNAFRLDRRRELPPSPNLPSNNDGAEQHDRVGEGARAAAAGSRAGAGAAGGGRSGGGGWEGGRRFGRKGKRER